MSNKFTCFVCGYRTLDERCGWDVCPICFWEDDVFVENDEDITSPANNGMAVSEAQANFISIGASCKDHVDKVRSPNIDEERDPAWKPLSKALDIVRDRNGGASSV